MLIGRDDELAHQPDGDPSWSEWWSLAWWAPDASIGGTLRLETFPILGRSWLWATCIGPDRPTVSVCADDVPLPSAPSLELRASGLWVDVIAETPGEHMTVGLEAFGVAMDDPAEGFGRGWGDRTPLGLDLEWETTAAPVGFGDRCGHAIRCMAHGEVLVGSEAVDLDGHGIRSHGWGRAQGLVGAASWCAEASGAPVAVTPAEDEMVAWAGAPVPSFGAAPILGRREALFVAHDGSWSGWRADVVGLDRG